MPADQGKRPNQIPIFESVEEEAAFWDSHDGPEFDEELAPVDIEITPPGTHVLSIRLDRPTFRRMCAEARRHGVGPSTLART